MVRVLSSSSGEKEIALQSSTVLYAVGNVGLQVFLYSRGIRPSLKLEAEYLWRRDIIGAGDDDRIKVSPISALGRYILYHDVYSTTNGTAVYCTVLIIPRTVEVSCSAVQGRVLPRIQGRARADWNPFAVSHIIP